MNAKMIIGICLVVFIVAGLIILRVKTKRNNHEGRHLFMGAARFIRS